MERLKAKENTQITSEFSWQEARRSGVIPRMNVDWSKLAPPQRPCAGIAGLSLYPSLSPSLYLSPSLSLFLHLLSLSQM